MPIWSKVRSQKKSATANPLCFNHWLFPSTRKSVPVLLTRSCCRDWLPKPLNNFILTQLDRAGLGHNTFTAEALALIVRSGEGLLRRTRNLCLSSLIETVRDQIRVVDLKQVNRVLIQPHWRKDCDQPIV